MAQPPEWPYAESLIQAAIAEYGRPETYFEERFFWSPERLRAIREERLKREIWRAWEIPFYRRRWEAAAFHPGAFRRLEDLARIPPYTVEDIRGSLETQPPYGDYQALIPGPGKSGLRMYMSGGTTGRPRPTVYSAWDRVVGSLMVARGLHQHGFLPGDVVLNAWSYGTHNAAWVWDEALWLWIGCLPITVSTGNVTSSVKQLELARDYGATSILTTSDYLLHLKKVADAEGFARSDFKFRSFQTIGDVKAATAAWEAPAYEIYAFHEVQTIAGECRERGGLHVWDDAFILEIVDTERGELLPPGEQGDLVVTCLYKSGSPQIRYNIKDLSTLAYGRCDCGSESTRMGRLAGRSDTMVKLRGINVWPEAVGSTMEEVIHGHLEYFCVAHRIGERDEMVVLVEEPAQQPFESSAILEEKLGQAVQSRLGIRLDVQLVSPGSLDQLTGRGTVAKLRRFRDDRKGERASTVLEKFAKP